MQENKNKIENTEEFEIKEDNKRTKILWLFVAILFFVVSIILVYMVYHLATGKSETPENALKALSKQLSLENGNKNENEGKVRRMIDGVYVLPGEENVFPIAVMIDNHYDARPQAGLNQANLVYEAEAEGSVTRYLAVFASNEKVDAIGPVRSARPYFIDWARELGALYAHVGGSPEALVKIKKEHVFAINEFYNGQYFWRNDSRPRPHNVFTSTDNIFKYFDSVEMKPSDYFSWKFKDDNVMSDRGEENSIEIYYSLFDFIVKWDFNKENNNYSRTLGGVLHKDADGEVITAKNIVIETAEAEVLDNELRLKMDSIGEGEAVVCMDGTCEKGRWKKPTAVARTRYYKADGEEFMFNAGTTWVEVVRPEIEVVFGAVDSDSAVASSTVEL